MINPQESRLCPKSCANVVGPSSGAVSVRCLHGVTEPGHVQVAARGPLVGGDVADARADEHERAPAVFLVKLVFRFGGGDVLLDSGVLVL